MAAVVRVGGDGRTACDVWQHPGDIEWGNSTLGTLHFSSLDNGGGYCVTTVTLPMLDSDSARDVLVLEQWAACMSEGQRALGAARMRQLSTDCWVGRVAARGQRPTDWSGCRYHIHS